MVQQSYLDVYPSSSIARQFKIEELRKPENIRELFLEINQYIKVMEQENIRFLHEREKETISSTDTLRFFRSQERTRNTRLILQYLMTFLKALPTEAEIDKKLINPFDQLKSFIQFSVNLLKEPDVTNAILREHERLGLLNETNSWYYRGQINKSFKQILEVVENARNVNQEEWCKLFEALHRLTLFWFSVRSENIKRVRKSDIYIFKLSMLLLNKYSAHNPY